MLKKIWGLAPFILASCSIPFLHKAEKPMIHCAIKNFDDVINLFPTTVDEINKRIQKLKVDVKIAVQKILDVPADKRNFANTAQALDDLSVLVEFTMGPLGLLRETSPQAPIRDASYASILEMQPFLQEEVSKNIKLFEAFKAYFDGNAKKESLNSEQRYYLDETMKAYKREGLLLPSDKLEQVKKLKNELAELSLKFSKNIADVDTKLTFSKEELNGLPEQILASLKKDEKGNYIVGMDYPTVLGILNFVTNAETRKKVSQAFRNRAYPANYPILQEIMRKRDALAKLLGFKNYVYYDFDNTMAQEPAKVRLFLDRIREKAVKKEEKEFEQLTRELPPSVTLSSDHKIYPWDMAFLKEEYKKKHFNLDEKKVTEYFPVDHVIAEVLKIYAQFLGLRFEEFSCKGLWDDSVRCIRAFDNSTLRGYILLDLYPRPNKYSHACMVDVILPHKVDDTICPAVIAMLANFPKGTNEFPGLLKFDDVSTFFHEFGHVMHGLLGATSMTSFAGTNVKNDFVETPSQMFEEWLKDKEILKKLSKHYKTGKSLPDDMIEKIIELDKFDAGDIYLRQIALGLFSLGLFADPAQDIQQFFKEMSLLMQPYIVFDEEGHMPANFGHLASGLYGSKYYNYLWAKIFALDLFEQIKKAGLLNPAVGKKVVVEILSKGGSVDPNILLRNFLGREPNEEAFLKNYGFEA